MGILKNLLVTGAARFVNTIKGSITHAQNGMYYGTCSTAAGTAAKVVELVDPTGFELKPGVMIAVKFSATSTASSVTLNVEGTGAKQVWYAAAAYTSTSNTVNGIANRIHTYVYDGTYWVWMGHGSEDNSNTYPSAQCETAAATAAKAATCTNYTLTANTYLHFNIRYANTVSGAITMNVNSKGAKPIYINGTASSASNYTLPAGTYIAFYNGTNWYFNTDGTIPGISGDKETYHADTVAAMKACTWLKTGYTVITLGYYSVNDGGGATYKIVSSAPSGHYETLSNGRYAQLIVDDNTTVDALGAKGDGSTNDYTILNNMLTTYGRLVLGSKTYYSGTSLKLSYGNRVIGQGRLKSVLKFASGVNGIQINHTNAVEHLSIDFSGDAAALYMFTPDNYAYNLSTVVNDLELKHSSESDNGSFIKLVAQNNSDSTPYGAYNLQFSNIQCRLQAKYGIELQNNVKTNAEFECWFTDIKFDNIFIDKVHTAIRSFWNDISGSGAAPTTGMGSVNSNIKFKNVSAQYTEGISYIFAIILNIRDCEFIACTPFDYYHLPNDKNQVIMQFNAYSNICTVNLGWMFEFPNVPTIYKYISFLNSSGTYMTDFEKVVTNIEVASGKIYGDYLGFNALNEYTLSANQLTTMTSSYGTVYGGYKKVGTLVIGSFAIVPSSSVTIPTNTNIFSTKLPAPLSQRGGIPIQLLVSGALKDAFVRYDGSVYVTASLTASASISFSVVYITL